MVKLLKCIRHRIQLLYFYLRKIHDFCSVKVEFYTKIKLGILGLPE